MAVFVRAVIMLVTLVGLPAAWIYYGPLPAGPQKVVDRFVEVARNALGWKQEAKCPTMEPLGSAPRFGTQDQLQQAPAFSADSITPTPQPEVIPTRPENQILQNAMLQNMSSSEPVTLASAQLPSQDENLLRSIESPPADDLQQELRPHLDLLRSLGAVDYKLEKWGTAGREYRFSCSIALGSDATLTRNFQEIDADPAEAVRQVVGEVTAWQNARLAPGESMTRLR